MKRKFKLGVRRTSARSFWAGLEAAVRAQSHEALANTFELARPDVTKGLDYGALSLENMLIVMHCLTWGYADLPQLPPYEERCVGGYAEAVASIVHGKAKRQSAFDLDLQAVLAITTLLGNSSYHRALLTGSLDQKAWQKIVHEIRPQLMSRLRLPKGSGHLLRYQQVADFQFLRDTWAAPFARCLATLPNRWVQLLETPHENA